MTVGASLRSFSEWARPNTVQLPTIVAAVLSTSTISATWTAPIMKKPIAACASTCPGLATSTARIGTASSSITLPPITASSGASASMVTPLIQPANKPRVPSNNAITTNTGPSATSTASAIRAVTSRATVPSMNSIAPNHIMPSGENAEISSAPALACWMARKTTSIFCAKVMVADSVVPVRMPASQSGAPMARFQTTLW